MIIYEINLLIDTNIYPEFQSWLQNHIQEMLQFPGFLQANILKPEKEEIKGKEKLTVQYQLEDRQALERYFVEFADKMRSEGLKLFKDKFSAQRRVLELQCSIARNI